MPRITCLFFSLLLLFALPADTRGQKALREVKTLLKNKDYKGALQRVQALQNDSALSGNTKLYMYGIEANIGLNDIENEKIYLKQSYDTVSFYNTTLGIFTYTLKSDSCERLKNDDAAAKYRRANFQRLERHYSNLNSAARFFYKRGRYKETMQFLRMYLDYPHTFLGATVGIPETQRDRNNACIYLHCAYELKDYKEVERYRDLALRDTSNLKFTYESLVNAAEAEADSVAFVHWLKQGLQHFPDYQPFFARLTDYLTEHQEFDLVLQLSNAMLERDSNEVCYRMAQAMALLNLKQYDEAIAAAQKTLALDSTLVEMHYGIGLAYIEKAEQVQLPDNAYSKSYKAAKQKQRDFYAAAESHLETYRKAKPDSAARWALLLYKVYLKLSRGTKFEEIDRSLRTI